MDDSLVHSGSLLGRVSRVCDAHHHLWRVPPAASWPSKFLVDDVVSNCNQLGVPTTTIFVECRSEYRADGPEPLRPVGETEFVESLVHDWSQRGGDVLVNPCVGIVGFADLNLGHSVGEVLDAHVAASPERFKGIRYMVAHDPDPRVRPPFTNPPAGLLSSSSFRQGLVELVDRDLVFNAWVYHPQILEVAELARSMPELKIVLEHCGGPLGIGSFAGKSVEVFNDWRNKIVDLARYENVAVKLGGLTMDLTGLSNEVAPGEHDAHAVARLFAPYFLHLVENFGPSRCMLECNYPFESLGASYSTLWAAYSLVFSSFSDDERDSLFSVTAETVYGIGHDA